MLPDTPLIAQFAMSGQAPQDFALRLLLALEFQVQQQSGFLSKIELFLYSKSAVRDVRAHSATG
jgi:hypothetical protein